jgi:hypothetical protein
MADTIESRPLSSLAWGLVAFVALVVAMILILILTIALAVMFGYLTLGGLAAMIVGLGMLVNVTLVVSSIAYLSFVAQVVIAYMAGRWLLQKVQPAWAERPVVPLAVGLIVYVILRAVPGLGTLVGWLVVLLALGALWDWGRKIVQGSPPPSTSMAGIQPV